jgi:hypothetical protein
MDSEPLLPRELATVGEALYGPQWRQGFARDLGINDEFHLIQMEAGTRPIPRWVRGALVALAQARAARAMDIVSELILNARPRLAAVA